jgi:small nuclear ribonucleoprotein (snRNP)-like protein
MGVLACLDGNMNVLLTNAKEMQQETKLGEFKQILIRGNNVLFIKKRN